MAVPSKIKGRCGTYIESSVEFSYQDEWQTTNLLLVDLIGTFSYEAVDRNNPLALRKTKFSVYVRPLNEFPPFYPNKEQVERSFELRLFLNKLQNLCARSIGRQMNLHLPPPTYDFDTKFMNYSMGASIARQ